MTFSLVYLHCLLNFSTKMPKRHLKFNMLITLTLDFFPQTCSSPLINVTSKYSWNVYPVPSTWIQVWSLLSWSMCSNAGRQIINNSLYVCIYPSICPSVCPSDKQFLLSTNLIYCQTVINTKRNNNQRVREKGTPEGWGGCWWLLFYILVRLSETCMKWRSKQTTWISQRNVF